jgi:hypothetical protein
VEPFLPLQFQAKPEAKPVFIVTELTHSEKKECFHSERKVVVVPDLTETYAQNPFSS